MSVILIIKLYESDFSLIYKENYEGGEEDRGPKLGRQIDAGVHRNKLGYHKLCIHLVLYLGNVKAALKK